MSVKNARKTLILLALISTSANASTSTNKAKKVAKDWSVGLKSTISQNLYDKDSTDYVLDNVTKLSLSAKLGKKATLSLGISYAKDLYGAYEGKFSDLSMSYSRSLFRFNKYTSMSLSTSMVIPTTKASKKISELRTRFSFATPFSWSAKQVGLKNVGVSYTPYLVKSFHEYEVSKTGGSNIEWSLGHSLGLNYSLTEKIYMGVDGSYGRSFTYKGTPLDSYSFGQYIGASINKNASITFGHSLGGSPLAPNGQDTSIDIFDRDKGTVYTNISIRY